MFYSKQLNQFSYIHKHKRFNAAVTPSNFKVAVHPIFFSKSWIAASEGILEYINNRKKKSPFTLQL